MSIRWKQHESESTIIEVARLMQLSISKGRKPQISKIVSQAQSKILPRDRWRYGATFTSGLHKAAKHYIATGELPEGASASLAPTVTNEPITAALATSIEMVAPLPQVTGLPTNEDMFKQFLPILAGLAAQVFVKAIETTEFRAAVAQLAQSFVPTVAAPAVPADGSPATSLQSVRDVAQAEDGLWVNSKPANDKRTRLLLAGVPKARLQQVYSHFPHFDFRHWTSDNHPDTLRTLADRCQLAIAVEGQLNGSQLSILLDRAPKGQLHKLSHIDKVLRCLHDIDPQNPTFAGS